MIFLWAKLINSAAATTIDRSEQESWHSKRDVKIASESKFDPEIAGNLPAHPFPDAINRHNCDVIAKISSSSSFRSAHFAHDESVVKFTLALLDEGNIHHEKFVALITIIVINRYPPTRRINVREREEEKYLEDSSSSSVDRRALLFISAE